MHRGFDILRYRYVTPSLRARDQVACHIQLKGYTLVFYVFFRYAMANSL